MVSLHIETARFKWPGHKNELWFFRNTLLYSAVDFAKPKKELGSVSEHRHMTGSIQTFQKCHVFFCHISIYKQMLERVFCSKFVPSLSSGNHLFLGEVA